MSGRMQKSDVVADIARELGVPCPRMSTGSTEPKEIFELVNEAHGLGIPASETKPNMARRIVEAAGHPWLPHHESRGGTVTLAGLQAVQAAVAFFSGR